MIVVKQQKPQGLFISPPPAAESGLLWGFFRGLTKFALPSKKVNNVDIMAVSVNTETAETLPVGPVVLATEQFAETPGPFEQMLRSAGNILNTHYTSYAQTNRAGNRLVYLFRLIDTTPHEYEIRIDETAQDQNGQFQTKWTSETDSKLRSTRLRTWVTPKFDKIIFSGIEFGSQQIDVTLSQNSQGTEIKAPNTVDPADTGKVVGALKTHIDRAEKYFGKQPQKPQLFNIPKSR